MRESQNVQQYKKSTIDSRLGPPNKKLSKSVAVGSGEMIESIALNDAFNISKQKAEKLRLKERERLKQKEIDPQDKFKHLM